MISPARDEDVKVDGRPKYTSVGMLPKLGLCSCGCGEVVEVPKVYYSGECAEET